MQQQDPSCCCSIHPCLWHSEMHMCVCFVCEVARGEKAGTTQLHWLYLFSPLQPSSPWRCVAGSSSSIVPRGRKARMIRTCAMASKKTLFPSPNWTCSSSSSSSSSISSVCVWLNFSCWLAGMKEEFFFQVRRRRRKQRGTTTRIWEEEEEATQEPERKSGVGGSHHSASPLNSFATRNQWTDRRSMGTNGGWWVGMAL